MASIIDSFRESFSDNYAIFKFILLTIPVYYSYQVYTQSKGDFTYFSWVAGITLFLLFGVLIKITNNVINERVHILPALNPIAIVLSSIKGIVAVGPLCFVSSFVANYLCAAINIPDQIDVALTYIIWFVASSVMISSFILFCNREKIIDAYALKTVLEKSGDLIVSLLFFVLQFLLMNVITTVLIGYIILVLFGFGQFFDFYVSLACVFNIAVIGHYLGQISHEVITYGASKKTK